MGMTAADLVDLAISATDQCRARAANQDDWDLMGFVGAALETDQGHVFRGVNLSLTCGIGFCAENSAVAATVTEGESRIRIIAAVTATASCSTRSMPTISRRSWSFRGLAM